MDRKTIDATQHQAPERGTIVSKRSGKNSEPHSLYKSNPQQQQQPKSRIYEKVNVNQLAEHIYAFLRGRGLADSQQLQSYKQLLTPQTRQFTQLFMLLLKLYDANSVLENLTTDDIPQVARTIGYPFTINRNILQSIGAPHTISHVLSLLSWMCHTVEYRESLQEEEEQMRLEAYRQGGTAGSDIETVNAFIATNFVAFERCNNSKSTVQFFKSNNVGAQGNTLSSDREQELIDRRTGTLEQLVMRQARLVKEERDLRCKLETLKLAHKNAYCEQQEISAVEQDVLRLEGEVKRERNDLHNFEAQTLAFQRDTEKRLKEFEEKRARLLLLQSQQAQLALQEQQQPISAEQAARMEGKIQQQLAIKERLLEQVNNSKRQLQNLQQTIAQYVEVQLPQCQQQFNSSAIENSFTVARIDCSALLASSAESEEYSSLLSEQDNTQQQLIVVRGFDHRTEGKEYFAQQLSRVRESCSDLSFQVQLLEREGALLQQRLTERRAQKRELEGLLRSEGEKCVTLQDVQRRTELLFGTHYESLCIEVSAQHTESSKLQAMQRERGDKLAALLAQLQNVHSQEEIQHRTLERQLLMAIFAAEQQKVATKCALQKQYDGMRAAIQQLQLKYIA